MAPNQKDVAATERPDSQLNIQQNDSRPSTKNSGILLEHLARPRDREYSNRSIERSSASNERVSMQEVRRAKRSANRVLAKISKEQDQVDEVYESNMTTPEKIIELKQKRQVVNLRDSINNASKIHIRPDLPAVLESQETKKLDGTQLNSV